MDAPSPYTTESNMLPSNYPQASGTAAFKLDEGFSEDPRGQDDSDLATTMENTSGFEEWVMAQSEDARAGKYSENTATFSDACNALCFSGTDLLSMY
jgi:hypothetical protein